MNGQLYVPFPVILSACVAADKKKKKKKGNKSVNDIVQVQSKRHGQHEKLLRAQQKEAGE